MRFTRKSRQSPACTARVLTLGTLAAVMFDITAAHAFVVPLRPAAAATFSRSTYLVFADRSRAIITVSQIAGLPCDRLQTVHGILTTKDRFAASETGFIQPASPAGRADPRIISAEPTSRLWQTWTWPIAMRVSRFFGIIT